MSCKHCDQEKNVINKENSPLIKEIETAYDAITADSTNPINSSKKKFAILTCMDPRITPSDLTNFAADDAYIIRNAGGRSSDDAIRSLIVSHKLLKTSEWFVIQHTDCGMQKFNNCVMGCLLKHSLEPAKLVKDCNKTLNPVEPVCKCQWKDVGKCPGNNIGKCIDWLPILHGLEASVLEDVEIIRQHPLVPENIPIYGYIYDVVTHKLIEVPAAMVAGRAKKLCCNKKNSKDKICSCCK